MLFFSLVGVVAVFTWDHGYFRWTTLLPRNYTATAWWVLTGLIEFVSLLPAMLVTGVPLGIFIRKRPPLYGLTAFAGAFVFSGFLHSRVWRDSWINGIAMWYYPIGLGIFRLSLWIGLFVLTTSLGYYVKGRRVRNSPLHFVKTSIRN